MKPWRRFGGVGCPSAADSALVLSYDPVLDNWTWTWPGADPPFWQFRIIRAGVFVDLTTVPGVLRVWVGLGPGTFRLAGTLTDPALGVFSTVFSNTVDVF